MDIIGLIIIVNLIVAIVVLPPVCRVGYLRPPHRCNRGIDPPIRRVEYLQSSCQRNRGAGSPDGHGRTVDSVESPKEKGGERLVRMVVERKTYDRS